MIDSIEEDIEAGVLRESLGAMVSCYYNYLNRSAMEFAEIHVKLPGSALGK